MSPTPNDIPLYPQHHPGSSCGCLCEDFQPVTTDQLSLYSKEKIAEACKDLVAEIKKSPYPDMTRMAYRVRYTMLEMYIRDIVDYLGKVDLNDAPNPESEEKTCTDVRGDSAKGHDEGNPSYKTRSDEGNC